MSAMIEKSRSQGVLGQGLLSNLGGLLRGRREVLGMSLSELARRSGVSRRHLTEIEAGRCNLTVARLAEVSQALALRPGELLDESAGCARPARAERIALVGLRGAGKSTVGRGLALALEVPFFELDRLVEEQAGLPLSSIFEMGGGAAYRRLESEALERVLAGGERFVLAVGGSIVTSPETFARLQEACHTVWLAAAAERHYERVVAQGDRRPMEGRPRALEELRGLLAQREPSYARCALRIDTTDLSPDEVVARLLARLPGAWNAA